MTRTLADYRPQHDEDCQSQLCHFCKQHESACYCDHLFVAGKCTCGLDALLALPVRPERTEEKDDDNAETGPFCESCNEPATCTTSDDVDMCAECYQVLCDEQGVTGSTGLTPVERSAMNETTVIEKKDS